MWHFWGSKALLGDRKGNSQAKEGLSTKLSLLQGRGGYYWRAHQETAGLGWGRQSCHRYRMMLMLGCEVVAMGTLIIREDVLREGSRK